MAEMTSLNAVFALALSGQANQENILYLECSPYRVLA